MRRGRPRYPDLLTPREQEVLHLLREGLTNQQIADRLGIGLYGARYHVSEILSKLGVGSREEAAAWQPEAVAGRFRLPAFFALPLHKLVGVSVFKVAGVAAIGVSGMALGLLALGVVAGSSREPPPPGDLGKLAYIQDGNLWVRSPPDADGHQLTDDGEASYPRWSPSGEWLTSGLEVMRADGSERRRAPLCGSWSPVSDEFVCIVDHSGTYDGVRIERPDGRVVTTIDFPGLVAPGEPALSVDSVSCADWSPDGDRLACRVEGARTPLPGLSGEVSGAYSRYSGLWVIEADGSEAREVVDNFDVPNDHGAVGIVGWTADGSSVLFQIATSFSASIGSDGLRLYSVPADGGAITAVQGTLLGRDEIQDWRLPASSVLLTEGGGRETWTQKRIAVADLETGSLRYLTPPDEAAFSPAMSPDGRTIAYATGPDIGRVGGGDLAREGAAKRRIWLMNADGSNRRLLTDDSTYRDERPQWSADGEYVMFTRLDGEDRASLWVVAAPTGGKPVKLADVSRPTATPGASLWFGFYGYIAWDGYFDWWQP